MITQELKVLDVEQSQYSWYQILSYCLYVVKGRSHQCHKIVQHLNYSKVLQLMSRTTFFVLAHVTKQKPEVQFYGKKHNPDSRPASSVVVH